jgi:hypothetical protein
MNSTAGRSIATPRQLRLDRNVNSMLHLFSRTRSKLPLQLACLLVCLIAPAVGRAQGVGQVECARQGDFVYLYSSMTTLDVRATLQCGQQVEVTGRYDQYFGVRTADGQTGYVPIDFLLLVKTAPGAKPVLAPTKETQREKMAYDPPAKKPDAPSETPALAQFLVLLDSTPIRMKLGRSLSSSDAQVGDEVDLEVTEDVVVDGFLVVAKGATATGVINEAEPKKALGRGGKLGVLVRSVRLTNNQEAVLRSGGEGKGSSSTAGMVIPVMHGKDITFPKGMDFTAYVNGDTRLKRDNFHPATETPDAPPSGKVSNLPHP